MADADDESPEGKGPMRKRNQTIIFWSLLAAMIILAIGRIALGKALGNFMFVDGTYDDWLFVEYSDLKTHFAYPNADSLLKNMSFAVFLWIIEHSFLDWNTGISLLWILAAACCWLMVWRLSTNKWLSFGGYVYILFAPAAYDIQMLRIYRNAIIAPVLIILFALMIVSVYESWNQEPSWSLFLVESLAGGLVFTFAYYIKEDGFWLMAVGMVWLVICLMGWIRQFLKGRKSRKLVQRGIIGLVCLCITPASFGLLTNAYLGANESSFGVGLINSRTEGAMARWINDVYQIESSQQDWYCWAGYDAIEKAFDASPALSQYPQLKDSVLHSSWFDGGSQPIYGDFLGWVLHTSLQENGMSENDPAVQQLFEQAALELEQAFEEGTVQKSDKIFLTSSAGGRTLSEVMDLVPYVCYDISLMIWPRIQIIGAFDYSAWPERTQIIKDRFGIDLAAQNSPESIAAREIGFDIAQFLCVLYGLIHIVTLAGGIVLWFWLLVRLIRKKQRT